MRLSAIALIAFCTACGAAEHLDQTTLPVEATGHWRSMTIPARVGQRYRHSAIYTGTKMIIYGGIPDGPRENCAMAAEYDPATDVWTEIPDGPMGWRNNHFAVWIGDRMLVWGGYATQSDGTQTRSGKGALYDPATRSWTSISTSQFAWRKGSAVVYATTTRQIISLGGNSGESDHFEDYPLVYDLATDTWAFRNTTPLLAHAESGGIWTGTKFVYFGGRYQALVENQGYVVRGSNRGEEYDPTTQTWNLYRDANDVGSLDITDAPTKRAFNRRTGDPGGVTLSAVNGAPAAWYGGKDIASDWDDTDTGALYVASSPPTWKKLVARDGASVARRGAAGFTTPNSLFIWGGSRDAITQNSGVEIDFATGTTHTLPTPPASLPPRMETSAVWTGSEAILYGGHCDTDLAASCSATAGAVYTP